MVIHYSIGCHSIKYSTKYPSVGGLVKYIILHSYNGILCHHIKKNTETTDTNSYLWGMVRRTNMGEKLFTVYLFVFVDF